MWQLICLQLETCLSHIFLTGEVSSWACSETFACCTGMAHRWGQHTLWGNSLFSDPAVLEQKTLPHKLLYDMWLVALHCWRLPCSSITAFTSWRTNLSPFSKGCREWDASMWLPQFLRSPRAPTTCHIIAVAALWSGCIVQLLSLHNKLCYISFGYSLL